MGTGMKKNIRIIMLIVWIVLIFVVTGFPTFRTPKSDAPIDKLYHFAAFFILGVLEFRVLSTIWFFVLGCSVVILSEVQQIFILGREFELLDIVAGMLGLGFFFLITKLRDHWRHAVSKT
jgi:VanZ family protein